MKYYHGSQNPNIEKLTTDHSRDGFVYATTNRLVALTYAVKCFPNLFSTQNGKECFYELKPNLFEKMIKGKKAYIYTLEDKNFEPVEQSKMCGHQGCFKINQDVNVVEKEEVADAYAALLKYQKSGEFSLIRYNELDPKIRDAMTKELKKCIQTLSEEKLNDPNSFWKLFLDNPTKSKADLNKTKDE